jgi:hypothetical protein
MSDDDYLNKYFTKGWENVWLAKCLSSDAVKPPTSGGGYKATP